MREYIEKEPLLEELDRIKTFYAGDRDKYINMLIDYVQNNKSPKNIIELPFKKGDNLWKADCIFAQIDTPHKITSVTWTDGYFEFEVENSAYYDYDCITIDEIGKTYFKIKSARDEAFKKYVEKEEKAYFNSKLNHSQFTEKYCDKCGSQRCLGPGSEWFDGCAYKNELLV